MNQGILERIEAKLDQLLATAPTPVAEAVRTAVTAPVAETAPTVPVAETVPTVPVAENAPAGELDKEGQPWDARIHTEARTKTVKGIWKLMRGVDKDLVPVVQAENAAKLQGTAPNVPTVPTAPAAPTAPTVPAAPTAPAADPHAEVKKKAMSEMNSLTHTYKVDADTLLEPLEDFKVKLFSDLKPEQYESVWVVYRTWREWLDLCQGCLDAINGWYPNGEAQSAIDSIIGKHGVKSIALVHHKEVAKLHENLENYRKVCQNAQG